MAKSSKSRSAPGAPTRAETLMEKTTRAAREIIDDQNAQRERKTERLRKARLERESAPADDPDTPAKKAGRKKSKEKPSGKS